MKKSIGILLLVLIVLASNASFAQLPTLLILPFKINAPAEYAYLQDGVLDLMFSDLAEAYRDVLIARPVMEAEIKRSGSPASLAEGIELSQRLGAQRLVFGSLTVFGQRVAILAEIVDSEGSPARLRFAETAETLDDVLPAIERLLAVIKLDLATKPADAKSLSEPTTAPSSDDSAPAETEDYLVAPDDRLIGGFKRLWEIKQIVTGVAIGDIDGDQRNDLIITDSRHVWLSRHQERGFQPPEILYSVKYRSIVGVQAGDINGDGKAEIYLTCLNAQKTGFSSLVLAWQGNAFLPLLEDAAWIWQIRRPQRGQPELFGQIPTPENPFSGKIVKLHWAENRLRDEPFIPQTRHNLLGLALDETLDAQNPAIFGVGFNEADRLEVFNRNGEIVWSGADAYGGNNAALLAAITDPGSKNRKYLPLRLYITDINGDGAKNIFTVQNHEMAGGVLMEFRKFTHFQFCSLSWHEIGLVERWRTVKHPGYISDFTIGDALNNGSEQLVAAIVQKEGAAFFIKPLSVIVLHDLPLGPK